MMASEVTPRLSGKARLRWDARERKYLLLYPERGLLLNEAAHAVVALCDGRHDLERMTYLLAVRFGLHDRAFVRREVSALLERLEKLGVLALVPPQP